jgi:hypothetical protein
MQLKITIIALLLVGAVFIKEGYSQDNNTGTGTPSLFLNPGNFNPHKEPIEFNTDMVPFPNNGWTSQPGLPDARWAHAMAFYRPGTYPNDTGFVYVISGGNSSFSIRNDVIRYNIVTGAWTTLAPIPAGKLQVSAVTVGSKIYVPGGYTSGFSPTNALHIYDIPTNTWSSGANMPLAVGDYAIGVYNNRYIYVMGGYSGSADVNNVQIYDTQLNTWSTGTALTWTAAAGHRGAIVGNKIIVAGGYSQVVASTLNQARIGTINISDPKIITWASAPNYPQTPGRLGSSSVEINRGNGAAINPSYALFTAGDPNGQGIQVLTQTYVYDFISNTWLDGPNKPSGVSNICNIVSYQDGDSVYIASTGGYNGSVVIGVHERINMGAVPQDAALTTPSDASVNIPLITTLNWEDAAHATSYRLQISTNSGFTGIIKDTTLSVSQYSTYGGLLSNLTQYYWRVSGINTFATSRFTPSPFSFTSIIAAPSAPSNVFPSNGAVNQPISLDFRWNKSLTATGYHFQLASDSLFNTLIVNDSTLTDSVKAVAGLNNLTKYWWRVRASNAGGNGAYSGMFSLTTIIAAPQAPSNVSPSNGAVNQPLSLILRWNKSAASDNYHIQLAADSLFNTLLVNDSTLTDSTKAISGLTNLTKYWWRVRAKNIGGTSAFSSMFSFTTIIAAPQAPSNVSPSNGAAGQPLALTLRWNKPASAESYHVQLAADSLFNTLIINDSTLTDSTRAVSGLNNLTKYWWKVRAKNVGGTSAYSSMFSFTTIIAAPQAPSNVLPNNGAVGQPVTVNLRWTKTATSVNYHVQLSSDSLFNTLIVNDSTLTDSIRTAAGLTPLAKYWWRVRAKNAGGNSAFSSTYSFKVIGPATTVTLINPVNNSANVPLSINFTWTKAADQTRPFGEGQGKETDESIIGNYWFELVTDTAGMTGLVRDTTLTDTVKSLGGLSNLTNYWWRVRARNEIGYGSFSGWFKLTTIIAAPTAPNLTAPANNSTGINLTPLLNWDSVNFTSSFRLQIAADSGFTAIVKDTSGITVSQYQVQGGLINFQTKYYWRVSASNVGGTSAYSSGFNFTTVPLPPAQVQFTVIPGGLYNPGTGRLNMKDTIKVYLVDSSNCLKVDSAKGVVDSVTFSTTLSFSNAGTGKYYLFVYHRNHVAVATKLTQNIVRNSTVSYNFTTDSAKAFGNNMIKLGASVWGMIPGDGNRDGFVDGLDQTLWIGQNGFDGYLASDFNGDGFVDGLDQTLWIVWNGQSYVLPCEILDAFYYLSIHNNEVIKSPEAPVNNNRNSKNK